ncbi:Conserved_hypothetical protein [Hexamita inflata]|uniref:Uncharacterized protein n=1 Tax=Hexamita inflata TaxID=28002 RepID=A0AA86URX7_9EUKA|nr:Conserved hypothetical protein [Hexamita inflata]
MDIWNIQPAALRENLMQFLSFKLLIDTIVIFYNFSKQKGQKSVNKAILRAQALRTKAGSGMNRDERRRQILDKYVKFSFKKLMKMNAKPNPMANIANPNAPPQMPQMDFMPLVFRFGPMMLQRYLFADKPAAVLYLPIIAKLEKKDDKVLKLLLKACTLGKKPDEKWAPGYVGKTAVGFVVGFIYKRILNRILFGKRPQLGFVERLQLQQELQAGVEDKKAPRVNLEGNENLINEFPDIVEISEVDAPIENTGEEKENSQSCSKL